MLAVLAANSPAAVTRERIAAMFWGDLAEERARHSLRQVLSALRRDAAIVEASGETLRLDARACTADTVEFTTLAASTDPGELERAVALYAGVYLDGLSAKEEAFEAWLFAERTRMSRVAVEAMARLAALHAEQAEHEAAVHLLHRLLACDPANEGAHRAMMRSLDALGRRSEALHQYHLCRELLLTQLRVEPDSATQALHDSIRKAGVALRGSEGRGLPVIAILPFANFARTPDLDALAASIGEDISGQLSRIPGVRVVVQPAVVAAMQPNPDDLTHLARVLGASYLITGSLRQPEPGCVRVAIQIVDGEKARYLWSLQQDLPSRDGNAGVDDFVAGTTARIEQQLALAEAGAPDDRDDGQDAWHKMHQASSALYSAGWSEAAVESAVRLYREVIALDPQFALARAQKAMVMAFAQKWGLLHGDAAREEARADAEMALELEPTRSEVLGVAGCAIAELGDPARAEPLLERAIEDNPNNAQAWAALGANRLLQMQFESAIEALRRGLRTSPTDYRRSVWLSALSSGLIRLNRLDEALDAAQGACRSDAKFYPARIVHAMVLTKLGRDAEAVGALAEARRIRPQLTQAEVRRFVGRALDGIATSSGFR
ncbi:MAG: tetratricopeptide repeat protein [Burkholderiales bacterium]|nr:tetratricopeptide repeat protein [Burkholderiales bacterium]